MLIEGGPGDGGNGKDLQVAILIANLDRFYTSKWWEERRNASLYCAFRIRVLLGCIAYNCNAMKTMKLLSLRGEWLADVTSTY